MACRAVCVVGHALTRALDVDTVTIQSFSEEECTMPRTIRSLELKVVPMGTSRGVRLPKAALDRYAIQDAVVVEECEDGLLLRSKKDKRLS